MQFLVEVALICILMDILVQLELRCDVSICHILYLFCIRFHHVEFCRILCKICQLCSSWKWYLLRVFLWKQNPGQWLLQYFDHQLSIWSILWIAEIISFFVLPHRIDLSKHASWWRCQPRQLQQLCPGLWRPPHGSRVALPGIRGLPQRGFGWGDLPLWGSHGGATMDHTSWVVWWSVPCFSARRT